MFAAPGGLDTDNIGINRHVAQQLYGGDALWFVIAKDAQGRLCKGYRLIETKADVPGPK